MEPGNLQTNSLAEFMARRGRSVVECCGVLWHSVGHGFYMSMPYEQMLNPDPDELARMLSTRSAIGARFPSVAQPGLTAGAYFCRRKDYCLKSVHPKHRPRVTRGLETFRIRQVDPDELLAQGLDINRDTMARQKRYDSEFGNASKWRRLVEALPHCPGIVAFGAFRGDRLAAYMIAALESRSVFILHQMSRQNELPDFPNHALTFHVTQESLREPHIDSVCYGFTSLIQIDGLHEYKSRFSFEVDTFNSVFMLHPLLDRILGSAPLRGVLHAARALLPMNQRLERVESVLQGARLSRSGMSARLKHV